MQAGKSELQWLINTGADENIGESPVNRFVISNSNEHKQSKSSDSNIAKATTFPQKTNSTNNTQNHSTDIGNKKAIAEAIKISKECNNIDDLSDRIGTFNHCSLKTTAKNTVYYRGEHSPDILCIGSAPSKQDDTNGKPFSGDSETLTARMFNTAGLATKKLAFTNSIFWYPPGQRSVTAQEFEICKPFLIKTIEITTPKLIIVFGNELAKYLFNETSAKLRQKPIQFMQTKTYVLHSTKQMYNIHIYKKQVWSDLKKIKECLK